MAMAVTLCSACVVQRRRGADRGALRARLQEPRVPGAPAHNVPGARGARVHHAGPRARRLLRAVFRAAQRGPPATGLLRPLRRHRRARRCALTSPHLFFSSILFSEALSLIYAYNYVADDHDVQSVVTHSIVQPNALVCTCTSFNSQGHFFSISCLTLLTAHLSVLRHSRAHAHTAFIDFVFRSPRRRMVTSSSTRRSSKNSKTSSRRLARSTSLH